MDQIVVKTEVQPNGEILLFYVDENAVDDNEGQMLHLDDASNYEILEANVQSGTAENIVEEQTDDTDHSEVTEKWSLEETQKLIVFFIDNKDNFNAHAHKQHLWNVACNTILVGRTVPTCEAKLRNLKRKYTQQRLERQKGYSVTWPMYDLCHQAFHDDKYVAVLIKDYEQQQNNNMVTKVTIPTTLSNTSTNPGTIVVQNISNKPLSDDKVETMLKLYLRYKKNDFTPKNLWETIARELGEDGAEYWHKRFLNFKQHYLRMLPKREISGSGSINWRYMDLFDQIFDDDPVFQSKYVKNSNESHETEETELHDEVDDWNDTEYTILAKYYFDCFDEFNDPTIPNNFLWTEVGRLLDKKPDICKVKYEEIKNTHYDKYFNGAYTLRSRVPLEIIMDNIISQEVVNEISKETNIKKTESWSTEEIDRLVQFLYENVEMFKDHVCFYVCWACISRSLNKSIMSCRKQWTNLKTLYKDILHNKMENSDMQIDWRYIDFFDRIFDYGMDRDLLNDFELKNDRQAKNSQKIGVHKVKINLDNDAYENGTDEEGFDEKGFTKRTKRGFGDSKAFKILEYYQKNKEKFSTTQKKKQALWEVLAKQIGITYEQCAHRFRNLKQVYTSYVQREIIKPEMPIFWPYYALCKKVFGYRAIKAKLRNNKVDTDEIEEWTPKEIKSLINYFGLHFNEIINSDDVSKWTDLAQELGKSVRIVRDKFVELKKSYRRLKTVKDHNPEYKVSWKYYNMFDEIYETSDQGHSEVMEVDEEIYGFLEDKNEDDEDYQCIIVIPEESDINDINDTQTIIQENGETQFVDEVLQNIQEKPVSKWTKKSKRKLLILYHNYIKARKGQEINTKEMWTEISSKLSGKSLLSCRKMFAKLKMNHLRLKGLDDVNKKKTPYYTLLERILALKVKFAKMKQNELKDKKIYKDVELPADKVELALQYYLENIHEFASPKFEKKYLWSELANFVSEPLNKLFNKINYLKQNYNVETGELNGETTELSELLKEIVTKEDAITAEISEQISQDEQEEAIWSDDEIEELLVWYLANLDKFKNPKFVRKYLWLEVSSILEKSPLACSKKMTEVRTQYKTMIKSPDDLNNWRFYELCQKIYGTGKKADVSVVPTEQTE